MHSIIGFPQEIVGRWGSCRLWSVMMTATKGIGIGPPQKSNCSEPRHLSEGQSATCRTARFWCQVPFGAHRSDNQELTNQATAWVKSHSSFLWVLQKEKKSWILKCNSPSSQKRWAWLFLFLIINCSHLPLCRARQKICVWWASLEVSHQCSTMCMINMNSNEHNAKMQEWLDFCLHAQNWRVDHLSTWNHPHWRDGMCPKHAGVLCLALEQQAHFRFS